MKIILSFGLLLAASLVLLGWLAVAADRALSAERELGAAFWRLGFAVGASSSGLGADGVPNRVGDVLVQARSTEGSAALAETAEAAESLAGARAKRDQAERELSRQTAELRKFLLTLAAAPPNGVAAGDWQGLVGAALAASEKKIVSSTDLDSLKKVVNDIINGQRSVNGSNVGAELSAATDRLLSLLSDLAERSQNLQESERALVSGASSLTGPVRSAALASGHGLRIFFGLVVLIVLSTILFFVLSRSVMAPLTRIELWLQWSARDVNNTARSLSRSSRSLAKGASENTRAVLDAISSLEVLLNTAKKNAGHADQAKELMDRAKSFVDEANVFMGQISAAMEEIKNSGEASSQIVKTVDEIAFQTNILALNAAVEAARAGEAGLGFAVVADEVRNLANSSSGAAKSITSMLDSSSKRIIEGAALVKKAEESFESLVATSDEAAGIMSDIALDSQSQTREIQDVHQSIAMMDKVTQENALEAAETGNISAELDRQADLLNQTNSHVSRVVSGRRGKAEPSTERAKGVGGGKTGAGRSGAASRQSGAARSVRSDSPFDGFNRPEEPSGGSDFIAKVLDEDETRKNSPAPKSSFGKKKKSDLEQALPMDDDDW
jgi:methyl-accepting chemotaxis protein